MTAKVFHRDRLPDPLQPLADAWEAFGTFDVTVPPSGGNRDDAMQAVEWAKGRKLVNGAWVIVGDVVTYAQTAGDSAHGHGGAGDFFPVRTYFANGMPATVYLGSETEPGVRSEARGRFQTFGTFAETAGFEWGGRFPHPDAPHVQHPKWRTFPRVVVG